MLHAAPMSATAPSAPGEFAPAPREFTPAPREFAPAPRDQAPAPRPGTPAVEAALAAMRAGRPVLVVEDLAPGSTVWAVAAAAHATSDLVNELATEARGILAVTLTEARARALQCPELDRRRAPATMPRYGVSVEASSGVSTGISAADRAETALRLADPAATAHDFVRPGHIMPVIVNARGTLDRALGPEAAHDLTVLAGLHPGALFCHALDAVDAVTAATVEAWARPRGWPVVRAGDVLAYRATHERLVRVVSEGVVGTLEGRFRIRVYAHEYDGTSHIALVKDPPAGVAGAAAPLVRLHSQCLTGDILHSRRCDCGAQLRQAMAMVAAAGHGAVVYLRQEGRGIGLVHKIRAYALQDAGLDTVDANVELGFQPDERDYAVAAQILRDVGFARLRLLTNNPHKIAALQRLGIDVVAREPLEVAATPDNQRYLQTKRDRMGHLLAQLDVAQTDPAHPKT